MNPRKRIFIIGHPGAGKALLAKTLAEKLAWQFIDADLGLEIRMGCTLTEIMDIQGENAFQERGAEILKLLHHRDNIVVTTDASIVCNEKNRQLLESEFVVYLKVSIPVQLERLSRQPTPLLPSKDLKTFLEKLHRERDNLYAQVASVSINSDDSALEKHVARIVGMVSVTKDKEHMVENVILDKEDLILFHKELHIPIQLTEQQAKCLKLLAQGKTSKEIAHKMAISYRTVEDYIAKTMELLGCCSSKELIALYHKLN